MNEEKKGLKKKTQHHLEWMDGLPQISSSCPFVTGKPP